MIEDEMKAIRKVSAALEGLPQRARNRVMRYVFDSEVDRELPLMPLGSIAALPMQCREVDMSECLAGDSASAT